MEDKILTCKNCGKTFMYFHGEQEYYNKRGYAEPKYCRYCRKIKLEERENRGFHEALMHNGSMRKFTKHGRGYFEKMRNW